METNMKKLWELWRFFGHRQSQWIPHGPLLACQESVALGSLGSWDKVKFLYISLSM
jgi:hypothetical protein